MTYQTGSSGYQVKSYTTESSYGTISCKSKGVCTCNGTICRGTCRG